MTLIHLDPSEALRLGEQLAGNACRAAMLQGKSEQPQNVLTKYSGKWSPVVPLRQLRMVGQAVVS
ncbi:hypothetical protein O5623_00620 [Escherichia coli]|nr:hypothetical protein [Escherichia coli]